MTLSYLTANLKIIYHNHNIVFLNIGADDEGSDDEKFPSCGDYVMHFLTIFWKIIFAFVPPTGMHLFHLTYN